MNLTETSTKDLVLKFNEMANKLGEKPVTKFADRKTAERRVSAAIEAVEKLQASQDGQAVDRTQRPVEEVKVTTLETPKGVDTKVEEVKAAKISRDGLRVLATIDKLAGKSEGTLVTAGDISNKLEMPIKATQRHLDNLVILNLVIREAAPKAAHYYLSAAGKALVPAKPVKATKEKAAPTPKGFRAEPDAEKIRPVREGSKVAQIIDLIARPQGATVAEMQPLMSPKATVRGILSYDVHTLVGYGYESKDGITVHILLPKGMKAPMAHNPRKAVVAPAEKK